MSGNFVCNTSFLSSDVVLFVRDPSDSNLKKYQPTEGTYAIKEFFDGLPGNRNIFKSYSSMCQELCSGQNLQGINFTMFCDTSNMVKYDAVLRALDTAYPGVTFNTKVVDGRTPNEFRVIIVDFQFLESQSDIQLDSLVLRTSLSQKSGNDNFLYSINNLQGMAIDASIKNAAEQQFKLDTGSESGTLFLIVQFDDGKIKISSKAISGAGASSIAPISAQTPTVVSTKFAIAAGHANGTGFEAAQAMASALPTDHPLRIAVGTLNEDSEESAVMSALATYEDMEPAHVAAEMKMAQSMSAAHPQSTTDVYPIGVATKIVDLDVGCKYTEAFSTIF